MIKGIRISTKRKFENEQEFNSVLRKKFQNHGYWWYKIPDLGGNPRMGIRKIKRPFDSIVLGKDFFAAVESKIVNRSILERGFYKLADHQIDNLCMVKGLGHPAYVAVGSTETNEIFLFNISYVLYYLINRCSTCPHFCSPDKHVYGIKLNPDKPVGLMVIGEAPSRIGSETGLPFQGKSKDLFWNTMHTLEKYMDKYTIFVTNMLKCYWNKSQGNIDRTCIKWLNRQYLLYNPMRVVIMGSHAKRMLLKQGVMGVILNPSVIPTNSIQTIPHPMTIIYDPSKIKDWKEAWTSIVRSDIRGIFTKFNSLPF